MDQDRYIAILKNGDKFSYAAFYDAYSAAIYGIILRMVKDEEVAAEILQDTFLKVWSYRDTYDSEKGRLFTWIHRIAKNLSLNYLESKRAKVKDKIRSVDDLVYNMESSYKTRVDSLDMSSKLNLIKRKYKQVLEMAYFEGYTHKEISDRLSLPLGTVKSYIKIGLRDLRKIYIEKSDEYKSAIVSLTIALLILL